MPPVLTRRLLAALIVASACVTIPSPAAAGGEPWDAAFLDAPPAELLAAASTVQPAEGSGVAVLLEEANIDFDDAGCRRSRYRMSYRVVTPAAVEGWSGVEMAWAPWHEQIPEVRARVVTPDGVEHQLDPATITDAPLEDSSPDVYSDRRIVRAPLPAVVPGAVVEQEIVIRERQPFFDAGSVDSFQFGRGVRVQRARLVLTSPAARPLEYRMRLLPGLAAQRVEEAGRVRLTFEASGLEPLAPIELGMPADVPRRPAVRFTSGRSWAEVAARYSEIVDRQIASADLAPLARELAQGDAGREAVAWRLLEWLRATVRYTGVEFGESSIVPQDPAVTMARRFGDCKDQSALLVKLLRAAGVEAHVALLRTSSAEDLDPELPGMGAFDHAIVFVPGDTPLWIDPTDADSRQGELPLVDQGRLALIASAGTTGLVLTPEAPSSANHWSETRHFLLAEQGGARVVETTELTGSIGQSYRRNYSQSDAAALRRELTEYGVATYRAGAVTEVDYSDPADRSGPFRVRLVMEGAKRGSTDEREAVVAVFPGFLTERLPKALTEEPEAPTGRRAAAFLLPEPYTATCRYVIVPPPGYRATALPDSGVQSFGGLRLSSAYRLADDGSVEADLTFDTGKRRLEPDEFEAARAGLRELAESPAVIVRFEHVGRALLDAGRTKEALAEYRRLASLHPTEALHLTQVALALLEAGLGAAARTEAERAIAVEPGSAAAHRSLGWILQHDLVGRRFGRGFDRGAAVAAYRKALELDPDDAGTRADLAILLEHDADGARYQAGADLDEAIAEYRHLHDELENHGMDGNLLVALGRAGRFAEVREFALGLPASANRSHHLIFAAAAVEGAGAAVAEARRLVPDPAERRAALEAAASLLFQQRLHEAAAELIAEAAQGSPNAAALRGKENLFRSLRRFERVPLPDDDPVSVARRAMIAMFVPTAGGDTLASLFSRDVMRWVEAEGPAGFVDSYVGMLRRNLVKGAAGVSPEVAADVLLGSLEFRVEGDPGGYRIKARQSVISGGVAITFHAVNEEGRLRLVGISSQGSGAPFLAMMALGSAERGELPDARRWLDWAREELPFRGGGDLTDRMPFVGLWSVGQQGDAGQIRTAAAALLAWSGLSAKTLAPILQQGRAAASTDEARTDIDLALAGLYGRLKDVDGLRAACSRLEELHPDARFILGARTRAHSLAREPEAATALAEAWLARHPRDPFALRLVADLAAASGDLGRREQAFRVLVEDGTAQSFDYNNLAWLGLFRDRVLPEDLKHGETAVNLSGGASTASLHTLAALYAETGKTAEAREMILKTMEGALDRSPSPADWYVLGRIAEEYGELAAAAEAYRKVTPSESEMLRSVDTAILARRRLAALAP